MRIPRDNLVRAVFPGVELREANGIGMRTMTGHFAVFDQWTEINSVFEGRFLERISPGAFHKTFQEGKAGIRSLFQHGQDPHIGNKPLGPVQVLEEDTIGAYYEVGLLDTSYNRDLLPGLEAGLYGASFRFSVTREDVNNKAKKSAMNPDALPERTIREAQVMEFGPVTFPAYKGATAGVRSMTDAFTLKAFTDDPDALRTLLDYNEGRDTTKVSTSISVPMDIPETDDSEERADYSADQRAAMAKKGQAIPIKNDAGEIIDGSYPIANEADLKNAIQAFGRAGNKAEVKAHIMKRARALGRTDLIPDSWKGGGMNSTDTLGEMRARLAELRDMTLPAESVDALGSLIEVCESSLEAMEDLLGIEDDAEDMAELQADMAEDAGEMNSTEPAGTVREDPVTSTPDAPPVDGAEAEPHPIRGRRDKSKSYLRKEKPSWQL